MKKSRIALLLIIILFIIAIIVLLYIKTDKVTWLSVRAYQGDRITVNMYVTVDGKKAEIINDCDYCRLKDNKECTVLKARANSYDTYEFPLLIKNGDNSIPLNITVRHWNWWEIVESNLYIDVDTKTNSYTAYEKYLYTAEYNELGVTDYHYETVTEPKEIIKRIDVINISAGCKG